MTQHIAVSPDGSLLASLSGDRTLRLWSTESGEELRHYRSALPLRGAAFSPDGLQLAVTFYERKPGERRPRPLPLPNPGKTIASNPSNPHQLLVFDVETGLPQAAFVPPMTAEFYEAAWSPDGKFLAGSTNRGQVIVFDVTDESPPRVVTASGVPGPAYEVHFSHDGSRLYAAGSGNMIWCWNWPEGTEAFTHIFQGGVTRFALSTDGRWLALGGALEVRLFTLGNPPAGRVVLTLPEHSSPTWDVAFVPFHDVVVSSAWDGTLRLWRLPPGVPPKMN
jgi:WD40 repeat protein